MREQLIAHLNLLRQRWGSGLHRAQQVGAAVPGRRLVLAEEILPLVDVLRSVYQEEGLVITWCIPLQTVFTGDWADVLELLGNLLYNTCKWVQQRMTLTIQAQPGLAFVIADDSPGCAPAILGQLTARGGRFDEATTAYGMGLAIARDIVEQYGGNVGFGLSGRLGGFRVWVTLPEGSAPGAR